MNVPPSPFAAPAAPVPPPPPAPRSPWSTGRILAFAASPGFLLAVLAFFLPWYAVSCSGQTLASATGFQAATSGFENADENPLLKMNEGSSPLGGGIEEDEIVESPNEMPRRVRPGNPSFSMGSKTKKNSELDELRGESMAWMLAFPILCLLGLGAAIGAATSQAQRAKTLAIVAILVAGACVVLQCVQLFAMQARLRAALTHDAANKSGSDMGDRVAGAVVRAITVEARGGWYLALLALIIAAILILSGMLARRGEPRAPAF